MGAAAALVVEVFVALRRVATASLVAALSVAAGAGPARAWDEAEHRALADSGLADALVALGGEAGDEVRIQMPDSSVLVLPRHLWGGRDFGEICAWSSRADEAPTRYPLRGRTLLEQVALLRADQIERILMRHFPAADDLAGDASRWPPVASAEERSQRVVANYLIHHLIAIRYAERAAADGSARAEAMTRALIYEAMAVGYLSDSFSSSHILAPEPGILAGLHRRNTRRAHDFYRDQGAAVINSRGEVWRTYGDGLLHWYGLAMDHVRKACSASIEEVLRPADSLRGGARDGADYYGALRMAALLEIPMPVAASWSVRDSTVDGHGIHARTHYPQLREEGWHDPDLEGIDMRFLCARGVLPEWMVFARAAEAAPQALIRDDPDVASVRYVEERHKKPTFEGGLLALGLGHVVHDDSDVTGPSIALGFGLADDLVAVQGLPGVQRFSAEAAYQPGMGEARRRLLSAGLGFQIATPRFPTLHVEGGYAWGLASPFKRAGPKVGIGVSTETLPLGFTYAGVILRAKYQAFYLERIVTGVFAEVVLH